MGYQDKNSVGGDLDKIDYDFKKFTYFMTLYHISSFSPLL